jgi:hypothetical protein
VSTIEVSFRPGANHKRAEEGAGLEILFAHGAAEGAVARRRSRRIRLLGGTETVESGEDLVGYFGLDGDEVEGGDADGSAGAHALRTDVEELPAEVEPGFGS